MVGEEVEEEVIPFFSAAISPGYQGGGGLCQVPGNIVPAYLTRGMPVRTPDTMGTGSHMVTLSGK